jgi:hypothetical protein
MGPQHCNIGHPLQPESGMAGTVSAEMEPQQTRHNLDPLMERNQMARFAAAQIVERVPKCFNRQAAACVPTLEIFGQSNPEAGLASR